ncbi:uncharacterized protein L201_003771 [Kwoniella dendrophila CBS 6074]|uniref:Uncharacterized protein n=1 Tax=Kwoniella dendrophila CBS 6074 TaxID=1295534 RepID=A0AAX4JTU3_9TREE
MSLLSFEQFLNGLDDSLENKSSTRSITPPSPCSEDKLPPRRLRDRFTSLCHSVTHLELVDRESSQGLVQILINNDLKNSFSLFKNVRYLILKNEFMRFLQKLDYKDLDKNVRKTHLHSRRVVVLLGRFLKPKHLCIEHLRVYDKKNPKSPEVWKVELMKKSWNLESITFHDEIGQTRMIFSNAPKQVFFVADVIGSLRSVLTASTEEPLPDKDINVTVFSVSPEFHTFEITPQIQQVVKRKNLLNLDCDMAVGCECCKLR